MLRWPNTNWDEFAIAKASSFKREKILTQFIFQRIHSDENLSPCYLASTELHRKARIFIPYVERPGLYPLSHHDCKK